MNVGELNSNTIIIVLKETEVVIRTCQIYIGSVRKNSGGKRQA